MRPTASMKCPTTLGALCDQSNSPGTMLPFLSSAFLDKALMGRPYVQATGCVFLSTPRRSRNQIVTRLLSDRASEYIGMVGYDFCAGDHKVPQR